MAAPSPKTIVFFGSTGVGKSSLINLLCNDDVADVGHDAVGETKQSQVYMTRGLRLIDTAGLNEIKNGTVSQEKAIKQLGDLVLSMKETGVAAFIYVKKDGRLKDEDLKSFKILSKFGWDKVPVIVATTHCEDVDDVVVTKEDYLKNGCKGVVKVIKCCAGKPKRLLREREVAYDILMAETRGRLLEQFKDDTFVNIPNLTPTWKIVLRVLAAIGVGILAIPLTALALALSPITIPVMVATVSYQGMSETPTSEEVAMELAAETKDREDLAASAD